MKKSILILFVLLSQVCFGQSYSGTLTPSSINDPFFGKITSEVKPIGLISMDGNGNIYLNGKIVPRYSEYILSWQKNDSIIFSLKARLDSLEIIQDKLIKELKFLKE